MRFFVSTILHIMAVAAISVALSTAISLTNATSTTVWAQTQSEDPAQEPDTAWVVVDGEELFQVRGASVLPAEERAVKVTGRIVSAAERKTAAPPIMEVRPSEFGSAVYADGLMLTIVTDADFDQEGMEADVLAALQSEAIGRAILQYRQRRSEAGRIDSAFGALLWTAAFAFFSVILVFGLRFFERKISERFLARIHGVEEATKKIVRADGIKATIKVAIRVAFFLTFVIGLYYYLSAVLYEFAETKAIASILLNYFTAPVIAVLWALIGQVPNLIGLTVIFLATRYLLKVVKLVFYNIEAGAIKISGFEDQWVWPTFRIIKVVLVLFALVFAYPLIPGSDSTAFKSISIILGVMLSFGSNSVVSNLLAGLFVIYKRSAYVGDRIAVGNIVGDVEAITLLETHLRSLKNELVSVPNSQMLNSEVTNYTRPGDTKGILVHTTVGIGYEEPWQKIEALLLKAVKRTADLKKNPKPFILRTALADYAVNYEINAYTKKGNRLPELLSDLHGNILDVFNENEVQIMTPSYVADPESPKLAPVQVGGA